MWVLGQALAKDLADLGFNSLMVRREMTLDDCVALVKEKGAEAISDKAGWSLAEVIEGAIAQRCREMGIVGKEKAKRA
jgi:hypothetical protein